VLVEQKFAALQGLTIALVADAEAQAASAQSRLNSLMRESAAKVVAGEATAAAAEASIEKKLASAEASIEKKLASAEASIEKKLTSADREIQDRLAAASAEIKRRSEESEARIASAEQLVERRLKGSEAAIATLQAELQHVRAMAMQAQQAAFRPPTSILDIPDKPSREQVLLLLPQNVNLSGLDLSGLDLLGVPFFQAQLVCTNFEDCDLRGAVLVGANLQHAKLARANLSGADMRDLQLQGAVGLGLAHLDPSTSADLRGAKHSFEPPDARPADGTVVVILEHLSRWGANYFWDQHWWRSTEHYIRADDQIRYDHVTQSSGFLLP